MQITIEQNMNLSTSLKINQTVPTGNNTGQLITLRPELYDPTSQAVCEEDKWHANFNADDSEGTSIWLTPPHIAILIGIVS
ncbi:Magnesium transport protein CorA [Dirofilaria immitis]